MVDSVETRILAEAGLYFAVLTGAPAGTDVRPTTVTVNNLRQGRVEGETLVARARTLHTGPSFTLAEVLIEDSSGRGIAHGVGTYVIDPIVPTPGPWTGSDLPTDPPAYPTPDPYLRPLPASMSPARFENADFVSMFRDMVDGREPGPPILELLGLRLTDISDAALAGTLRASEWLCLGSREVWPGVIVSMSYMTLAGVAQTLCSAGYRMGVLESSVTLVAPVAPDGRDLVIRGRVTHRRGPVVVCAGEVTDGDGDLVAIGHQTALLRPNRSRSAQSPGSERRIVTVFFNDIVKSTERAAELGDAGWTELLERHHDTVRKQLRLFKGTEVKTTGDGFLAIFDAPGQAIQAARAIRDGIQHLGLEIRVGLHTGECEVSKSDVAGIAVHIASRIQAMAEAGEILLSGTVHDLVAGSGLPFADRGRHLLKGVQGEWQVYSLADSSHS